MNIKFMKNKNKFFGISILLTVIVIVATFVNGVSMDIQFKGGYIFTYSYKGEIDKNNLRMNIEKALNTNITLQQTTDVKNRMNTVVISISADRSVASTIQAELDKFLTDNCAKNNFKILQVSNVDPTIGREFFIKCMVAVVSASIFIIIYIAMRFKKIGGWSAGVMAVIGLLHDLTMIYGTFVIFKIPLNEGFIAGCLTILGYSINDTIIIYDRIRENKNLYGSKISLSDLVDKSLNQSFIRSINTILTVIISIVVVLIITSIYGIHSIFLFMLPLLIGIITGGYSSIFIAGPLWVVCQESQKKKRIERIKESKVVESTK